MHQISSLKQCSSRYLMSSVEYDEERIVSCDSPLVNYKKFETLKKVQSVAHNHC